MVLGNIMEQSKVYFGFALADSMFTGDVLVERRILTHEQVAIEVARGVISCCNVSHEATVRAMRNRFGLHVATPETPSRVELARGDSVIVMGVRGLPRLTERREYTDEEIAGATFQFSEYRVSAKFMAPRGFETDLTRISGG